MAEIIKIITSYDLRDMLQLQAGKRRAWTSQLSLLLSGQVLEVYSRLSLDEVMDYEHLKLALLKRYDFTEFGYRRRFRDAKPEESPRQFIVQLKNYLTK